LLGTIHNAPGVHDISIVPELHRGFTTNGGNATVSVFDMQTFQTLKNISVAADPDFTFYDAALRRVMVCHGDSAQITEIDPDREEVSGTDAVAIRSEDQLFRGIERDRIHSVPAKTMAYDPKSGRLFLSAADMEPPPPGERRRPHPKPGSFHILVVEPPQ
jgi:hypothetical protein